MHKSTLGDHRKISVRSKEKWHKIISMSKVRDYHKDFYRPENLLLTITGRIDEKQLFETVWPFSSLLNTICSHIGEANRGKDSEKEDTTEGS